MIATLLLSLVVMTIDGARVDPFAGDARATAFVFIHPDCPISNRYSPELNRIFNDFKGKGISLWLVYPGRDDSLESIRSHYRDFALEAPALHDPDFTLTDLAGATMTPEAAVFRKHQRVYVGRVDDRAVRLGLVRAEPRTRDLAGVLTRIVRGEHVDPSQTQAVGCYIKPLP
jgi:hypothetical protein